MTFRSTWSNFVRFSLLCMVQKYLNEPQDTAAIWRSSVDGGEDYGYKAFMETIDVLVMGRHTYEKALTFAA
jgi:dihydrofolate reductase